VRSDPAHLRVVVDHLFREEAGKLTCVLARILGPRNVDLAEEVVQETLARALEAWAEQGLPERPAAWLTQAARNRAVDLIRAKRRSVAFAPDLEALLSSEWTLVPTVQAMFHQEEIGDDVLRMMFSCCHLALPQEAQVALILKLVCGFEVREIAALYLASEASLEKRLTRAKARLRRAPGLLELGGASAVAGRVDPVLTALYAMFSEGYHGSGPGHPVAAVTCREALRLCGLLAEHPAAALPRTKALFALMCLDVARLPGRTTPGGDLLPLEEQDRATWDRDLIDRGMRAMAASQEGDALSAYHVEAAIAAQHCLAPRAEDTDWATIVELYDRLLELHASPYAALARAVAVGRARGASAGLAAIAAISDPRLERTPFLHAAVGRMRQELGESTAAAQAFRRAVRAARSDPERRFLERKLAACLPRA
jgi:RNA polymerase sigma factor (sigma-70 family)